MADNDALVVPIVASQKDWDKSMVQILRNAEKTAAQLEKTFQGIKARPANDNAFGDVQKNASRSMQAIQNDARIMGFQLNDVFSGLAQGQGMRGVVQQLGQISQLMTGAGGIRGAAKLMGTALFGLPNIINLAILGFGLLASAALDYFGSTDEGIKKTDDLLQEHAKHIRDLKDAYGDAAKGAGEFGRVSDEALRRNLETDVRKQITALKTASKEFISGITAIVTQAAVAGTISRESGPGKAIADLIEEMKTGQPDIEKFLTTMARFAEADPANKELQAFNDSLQETGKESLAAQDALKNMKADLALTSAVLAGITGNAEKFNDALKAMADIAKVGLSDAEALFNAYTSAMGAAQGFEDRRAAIQQYDAGRGRIESGALGSAAIDRFVENTIQAESGGRANAKNPRSSATGPGQFIDSTWLDTFKKHYAAQYEELGQAGVLALRTDQEWSRRLIRRYAEDNAKALASAGHEVTEATLQLAHFLGAGGANKVLGAAPGTRIADIPGMQGAVAANPEVLGGGATREDVLAYAERRTQVTKAKQEEKVASDELYASNQRAIEQRKQENAINADSTATVNEKQAAIEQARIYQDLLNAAQADGITITDALKAKYQEQAATMANLGLTAANTADAQVEAERQKQQAIADTNQMASQMASLAQSAIGGFIADLRAGKDAGEAFANMINRITDQLINMALQAAFSADNMKALFGGMGGGGGGGGSILGALAKFIPSPAGSWGFMGPWGAGEKGGTVGQLSSKRYAPASVFAGAPHMQRGGMVLKPGEVPIIAHRGEVIIPRNLVGSAGRQGGGGNTVDNSTTVNNDLGTITIDMAGSGVVVASSQKAKAFGENVRNLIQMEMVNQSRPGGLLSRTPGDARR